MKPPWDDPDYWANLEYFANDHGEPCDCSGYREGVLEGITRRRKDEVLHEVVKQVQATNTELNEAGRKPLTVAETILTAWAAAYSEGFDRGMSHAKFRVAFCSYYGITEDEMPQGKELHGMIRAMMEKQTKEPS